MAAAQDDPKKVNDTTTKNHGEDKYQFLDVMNEFIEYGKTESNYITDWGRAMEVNGNDETDHENTVIKNLFTITQIIKDLNTGDITYKDICISVFGLYYKMNLIDYSSDEDILKELIKKPFADNPTHVNKLIREISASEVIINGKNLSKEIRRYMLFGNNTPEYLENRMIGGRSKARRSKARRSKATRSKATRSKATRRKARRSKARRSKATRRKNIKF